MKTAPIIVLANDERRTLSGIQGSPLKDSGSFPTPRLDCKWEPLIDLAIGKIMLRAECFGVPTSTFPAV